MLRKGFVYSLFLIIVILSAQADVKFKLPPDIATTPVVPPDGILDCPMQGDGTCTIRNMPLLLQTDPNVDPALQNYAIVGCYDAAIVTVFVTAQANRDPSFKPWGRAKTMLDIPAGTASKEIEQLMQQYRWAKQNDEKKIENGKLVQRFYLHEAVASTGGTIVEKCDPYVYGNCSDATNLAGHAFRTWVADDNVTNSYVIKLMQRNYVPLIAFARYIPATADGKVTFGLVPTPPKRHKVVFSGYRIGSKYPLRVNDVGDGQVKWARLTTDVSERGFAQNGNQVVYPTQVKTFLEYETDPTGATDRIFFIEHVDAMKLVTPADLKAMKATAPYLAKKGCKSFLGRTGDYLCASQGALSVCKTQVKQGNAQVCRLAAK